MSLTDPYSLPLLSDYRPEALSGSSCSEVAEEVFVPVPGFEGFYEVSNLGRIKSFHPQHPGRILRPTIGKFYPSVLLRRPGLRMRRPVHYFVAAAFLGPRPSGLEVCHNNGDGTDNRVANLRYDTRENNSADKLLHHTDPNRNKTHCSAGHEFTASNTKIYWRTPKRYVRLCRTCRSIYNRKWYLRNIAKKQAAGEGAT